MPYRFVIALALPLFLLLVGIEYYISRRQGKAYFAFTSSISNIGIGVAERLSQLFIAGYFAWVLQYIHTRYGLFSIRPSLYSWLLLFFLTDFLWYWYHRLSHTVNLLWGAHIVHHQSEEYNLTVSFRITVFQALVRFVFYLPLPFLGFPGEMILVTFSICGIYQFFIHTRLVNRLGWLEEIMVTPSHHRVHHGSNTVYLDKNYGGVFIIWDRLFGTFQRETEPVKFGLTKAVGSHSFLWLHFHFWISMVENLRRHTRFTERWKILFGTPNDLSYAYDRRLKKQYLSKSNPHETVTRNSSPQLYGYVCAQVMAVVGVLFLLYLFPPSSPELLATSLLIILTLVNCGAILEQKRWIFPVEVARFSAAYVWLCLLTGQLSFLLYLPIFVGAVAWNYTRMQHRYLKLLYAKRA